jgi:anti-anti-sigma factor
MGESGRIEFQIERASVSRAATVAGIRQAALRHVQLHSRDRFNLRRIARSVFHTAAVTRSGVLRVVNARTVLWLRTCLIPAGCAVGREVASMGCEIEQLGGQIRVAGEMTIYAAADLKATLSAAIVAEAPACVFDLSQVTELDTCGLQFLLMAKTACAARGIEFGLIDASDVVRETFGLLHLGALLQSPTMESDA